MDATLIIGGLFATALFSLIILILAVRSTPYMSQRKDTPTRAPATPVAQSQQNTAHTSDTKQQEGEDDPLEVTEGGLPAIRDQARLSPYGRQFQEFAIELHVLHRQVQDIEHRLGMLSQIMDRIEQADNRRTTFIEEEPHSTQHPSQTQ